MNKEERERMAKLEQKVTDIDSKLDNTRLETREDFQKLFNKIDNIPKEMDKTYVRKEVVDDLKKQINSKDNQDFTWKQNIIPAAIAVIAVIISIIGLVT